MMAFYHLSIIFSLRDKAHLFYAIYILLQWFYCISESICETPWLIDYTLNALFFLLSASDLLYGRFFLELKIFKWYYISIITFLATRIVCLFLFSNSTVTLMWLDLAGHLIVLVLSIISRIQKNKTATLFSIGFFVISIGYLINVL